jgi:hypothetical protein
MLYYAEQGLFWWRSSNDSFKPPMFNSASIDECVNISSSTSNQRRLIADGAFQKTRRILRKSGNQPALWEVGEVTRETVFREVKKSVSYQTSAFSNLAIHYMWYVEKTHGQAYGKQFSQIYNFVGRIFHVKLLLQIKD